MDSKKKKELELWAAKIRKTALQTNPDCRFRTYWRIFLHL